jgi:S1-C subfamily serine protease
MSAPHPPPGFRPRRHLPGVAASLACLGLALAAASCGGSSGGSGSKSTGQLSEAQVIAKVKPSVVAVTAQPPGVSLTPSKGGQHAHGSGVIYDAGQGLVLASDHVVENAGKIEVTVNGDTKVHARLLARAQCNDFVILGLSPKPTGLTQIKFGDSGAVNVADRVTAVGYLSPAGAPKPSLITTTGTVNSANVSAEVTSGLPPFPSLILHQAPLEQQMTGGPLVNSQGELVGLDVVIPGESTSGPYSAVTSDYIKRRLGQLRPGKGSALVGWSDQHKCHGQMFKIANKVLVSHGGHGAHGHH